MKLETKSNGRPTTFSFLSTSGTTMMEVEEIGLAKGKLKMRGKMMGEFPQDVYLPIDQLVVMLVMSLRPQLLLFVAKVPFAAIGRCLKSDAPKQWDTKAVFVISALFALVLLSPALLVLLLAAGLLGAAIFAVLSALRLARRPGRSPEAAESEKP